MRRNISNSGQSASRLGGQELSFALLLLAAYPAHRLPAQDLANNSGALFLVLPVGAQAVGMGQTAATLEGRGEAAFWNPAGLATLEQSEVAFNTASLAAGATHALTAYFPSHGLGVLGGQVAVGPTGALRVGVAVRNVGFRLQVNNRDQADPLPARLVVGALYRVALPGTAGLAGNDQLDLRLAADVDGPWGSYGDSQMRVGVDVGYQRLVRLRGGYAFVRDGLSGPSVGMGVSSGAIGVDLARTFLTGSDLVAQNPTFFSFRVVF